MNFTVKYFILTLCMLGLFNACHEDGGLDSNSKPVRLTTKTASNITASTATSGGNISNDGGTAIVARGVVWSTSRNPTTALSAKTSDGMTAGEFSSKITGLSPRTTYFLRAYATNRFGTEYGNEVGFETPTNLPTLSTTSISGTTASTVISGGSISNDGGLPITVRGVVWSTSTNPDISLSTKTIDGIGSGNFVSSVTGLTIGIKYYLRAYATNSAGTSYGNEIIFEPERPWNEMDEEVANKMIQYDIPGLSLAVIRNEKLVYLKSFGYSDKEENKLASNEDVYRIAGISKPITWLATLKLFDDGNIVPDQIVFGFNSILRTSFVYPPIGSGKELLTVRHLLDHKSGWINSPYDPMMEINDLTQTQIINDMLINRPLAYTPGTTYHLLNFGYCVLGRVIEKKTNISYERYVKSIMNEYGIYAIKVGGNSLSDRLPNEVKYYQSENNPYALNIKRMDAHDGWVASAKDLAKIMVRMDGNPNVPDILSTYITKQFPRESNWVHYGSLPGTSSIFHRLNDTFSFILLTNTRTENDPSLLLNDLDATIIEQIKARASWPSYDLF